MDDNNSTRVPAPTDIDGCLNDSASSNPQGRLVDDERHDSNEPPVQSVNRNIVSPKFTTYIGTYNARSLMDANKRSELAHL